MPVMGSRAATGTVGGRTRERAWARGRRLAPTWFACVVLASACGELGPGDPAVAEGGATARAGGAIEMPLEPYVWSLTDVALAAGVQDRLTIQKGVGAADFDGDGDLDLYLANAASTARLLVNEGDGTFRELPDPPGAELGWGLVIFDYDLDGDPDIFLSSGGFLGAGTARLFRNEGASADNGFVAFTDQSEASGFGDVPIPAMGGALADYDLDGDTDIFVPVQSDFFGVAGDISATGDTRNRLYRNEGDGTFTEVGQEAGVGASASSSPSAWLDVDEDGWLDLFVPVLHGDNILYRNLGDGTFQKSTPPVLRFPDMSLASIAQDVDHDGHMDLLVSEYYQPWMEFYLPGVSIAPPWGDRLYLGDGKGGFVDATVASGMSAGEPPPERAGTMGFQIGDLDLDGYHEILFGNGGPLVQGGEVNRLLSARPGGALGVVFEDRTSLIDSVAAEDGNLLYPYAQYPYRTHGSIFFDYDGDDDVDLFLGNGGADASQIEPNRLFRNDAEPVHGWVKVLLRGVGGEIAGFGSVVRVSDAAGDAATWQVFHSVACSSGFNACVYGAQQIGTGKRAGPYVVTVRWPGAVETVVEDVAPYATVELSRPQSSVVTGL